MMTADFWLAKVKEAEKIIATPEEIEVFNAKISKHYTGGTCDVLHYPIKISKKKLTSLFHKESFWQENKYLKGELLGADYYRRIQKEINVEEIGEVVTIKYGFTVRRTNLRILPTTDFITNRMDDYEFDRGQQTAVAAAQPLLVFHVSLSKKWYFVQSNCATGWVLAEDVGVTNERKEWLAYATMKKRIVVTGNRLRLGVNPYFPEVSELEFYMGDTLPLMNEPVGQCVAKQSTAGNYVVKLPVQQSDGQLGFKLALVPRVSDVCQGYLPYTQGNIIRQAFKMQGDRYGWGGDF